MSILMIFEYKNVLKTNIKMLNVDFKSYLELLVLIPY